MAIGPTVEMLLTNGHDTSGNGVNGSGYHWETDELLRSIFSWTEFMAVELVNS